MMALPKSEVCRSIMVVVNRYSKYVILIAAHADCKANEATRLFIKRIMKLWGALKSIVNERHLRFTGRFWTELFKLLKIDLKFSISFHPYPMSRPSASTTSLRYIWGTHQRDWAKLLDVAQFSCNLQRSEATGKSPFEIIMGFQPANGMRKRTSHEHTSTKPHGE